MRPEAQIIAGGYGNTTQKLSGILCILVVVGIVIAGRSYFLQLKTFNELDAAMLREQASRENFQKSALAKYRLRALQFQEMNALVEEGRTM